MNDRSQTDKLVAIIGAGPAGLTAAYELSKIDVPAVVLEKDSVVGGISRTVHYNGYHFDIGGHRFFTKVEPVERMWHEVLGDDLLWRGRMSRIYYRNKFFHYPLKPMNALLGLGLGNSFLLLFSYIYAKIRPIENERTFEDWVTNRFGRRLYETFFKTYTEKVWGISCTQLSAEWAAQRIKGLSLTSALKNALLKSSSVDRASVVKTLIQSFQYPKRGPGMMWERVAEEVQEKACTLHTNACVEKIHWSDDTINGLEVSIDGRMKIIEGTDFISSMPIRELVQKLSPPPPRGVLDAANKLAYRDFLTVALIVNKEQLFPDNWIYIHDPDVQVGRIQNFKNWSPYMVPDPSKSCIGLEYFCFEGDGLWTSSDAELIELGKREMDKLGLIDASDVEDGVVVRMPKAYPIYDELYANALVEIRQFLGRFENLQLVGRNGMHKYNNQDHSMLTAMLAVKNICGENLDLWAVNVDQDYHEEMTEEEEHRKREYAELQATQPQVPIPISDSPALDELLVRVFAPMDKLALAIAMGITAGAYIMLATLFLVLKGGEVVGPHMALLSEYFLGYTVTLEGAFIGFLYGFFWGFLLGWIIAYLRNAYVGFYLFYVKRRAEAEALINFLNFL